MDSYRQDMGWMGVIWRVMARTAILGIFVLAVWVVCYWWTGAVERKGSEIYKGVVYECREMPESPEIGGMVHLIRVDLKEPGVELYVTPKNKGAESAGWEYVTRWGPRIARNEGLAVAVNSMMFSQSGGNWRVWPGDFARSLEMGVAEHEVNHFWKDAYLLWFEDDLTPHMEVSKPPKEEVLRQARFGVGAGIVWYSAGRLNPFAGTARDRRTVLGIDQKKKLLFIGVFDSASGSAATRMMVEFGATQVMPMDGGSSTCLSIGTGARGVASGAAAIWPMRGLPVFFGVKAKRI